MLFNSEKLEFTMPRLSVWIAGFFVIKAKLYARFNQVAAFLGGAWL
jgi:hypothetical protein